MKIVIDIPNEIYKKYMDDRTHTTDVLHYVRKGTPLPKHHGDLVDRDDINCKFYDIWKELESYSNKPSYKELLDRWSMCMDTASTIIEGSDSE